MDIQGLMLMAGVIAGAGAALNWICYGHPLKLSGTTRDTAFVRWLLADMSK